MPSCAKKSRHLARMLARPIVWRIVYKRPTAVNFTPRVRAPSKRPLASSKARWDSGRFCCAACCKKSRVNLRWFARRITSNGCIASLRRARKRKLRAKTHRKAPVQAIPVRSATLEAAISRLAGVVKRVSAATSRLFPRNHTQRRQPPRELVKSVRENVTIDWNLRASVRAGIRLKIRKILRKHKYPPDASESATEQVLEQAEL